MPDPSLADDDLEQLGDDGDNTAGAESQAALDAKLDEALEETFPASDPIAVSRRSD